MPLKRTYRMPCIDYDVNFAWRRRDWSITVVVHMTIMVARDVVNAITGIVHGKCSQFENVRVRVGK